MNAVLPYPIVLPEHGFYPTPDRTAPFEFEARPPVKAERSMPLPLPILPPVPPVIATTSQPAQPLPTGISFFSRDYVSRLNAVRASAGAQALRVDSELTAAALRWAEHIASVAALVHATDLSTGISQKWTKLGENIGVGKDTDSIMKAFVASPNHYTNIIDPAFNRVGVGVFTGPDGRKWTAHRFMQVEGGSTTDWWSTLLLGLPLLLPIALLKRR